MNLRHSHHSTVKYREDKIIEISIQPSITVDLAIANEMIAAVTSVSEVVSPLMVISDPDQSYQQEALMTLSKAVNISALAIVYKTAPSMVVSRSIRSLFEVLGTEYPIELFNEEKEAVSWLKRFVKS